MKLRVAIALACLLIAGRTARAQDDGVRALLTRLESVVQAGDPPAYFGLLGPDANRERARAFASTELMPGALHVSLQERDRQQILGRAVTTYRVLVDVFVDFGSHGRVATWRFDVAQTGAPGSEREWTLADEDHLSAIESIYRLTLDATKSFAAHDLTISSEDIDLTLPEGTVFVASIDQGVTGLVLLGRGRMNFHPAPAMERGQVRIFCGSDTLETSFNGLFVRLNPSDFETTVSGAQLQAKPVDPRELKRAQDIFREESQKSFGIDLGDLSRDAWTLLPGYGDFLAEIRTRRFDTLTFAKSSTEAEDITLFDRKRKHNIALYASQAKLAQRGRFYNEDDLVDYDILSYDLDVAYNPDRLWLDGVAQVRLKVRAPLLGAVTMHLADPLVVQSIVSYEHGHLFGIRVKNQNTLVINLPAPVPHDGEINLTIAYGGRIDPQTPDREALAFEQRSAVVNEDGPTIPAEPSFLYSSRSYWYPQAPVTDYATARIRLTVPSTYECVASGELAPGFPGLLTGKEPSQNRKVYVFNATRPVRYLAFVVSRFVRSDTATIAFPPDEDDGNGGKDGSNGSLSIEVDANPRQSSHGRELTERASDIAAFYESIIGDSPYASFTIALVESELPGGHSPAYFAALNQPMPGSTLVWRNDPAAFNGFPDFFLAHELAHQWWGQAVGWRNYHEQWLSESFAQYFAAMYAQHQRGDETFTSVLRQMRKWGIDASDQGPVYLGYRLGHLKNESRVFRALVYNKGAIVLHMLRRLSGDEAFFRGLRRFYRESRFQKAGTEGLRAAMEAETGLPLGRFFERWIYGSTLPKLRLTYRTEGTDVVLRVEQVGDVFDIPVTIALQYADRKPVDVMLPLHEAVTEMRVPLAGVLRGADFSKDDGAMAQIVRGS
jgi:hypothetical protein